MQAPTEGQSHLGEHHRVGDDLGLAGCQTGKYRFPLFLGRGAVEVLRGDAVGEELAGDMAAVPDAGSEANSRASLGVFHPLRDDIANEGVGIHPAFELVASIVAGSRFHSAQVHVLGEDDRLDQEAEVDQVSDLWSLHDAREDGAETAAISPTRVAVKPSTFALGYLSSTFW
jgi:hypothetical protein